MDLRKVLTIACAILTVLTVVNAALVNVTANDNSKYTRDNSVQEARDKTLIAQEQNPNIVLVDIGCQKYPRIAFSGKENIVEITLGNNGNEDCIVVVDIYEQTQDKIFEAPVKTINYGMIIAGKEKTKYMEWSPEETGQHWLIGNIKVRLLENSEQHGLIGNIKVRLLENNEIVVGVFKESFNVVSGDKQVLTFDDTTITTPTVWKDSVVIIDGDLIVTSSLTLINTDVVGDDLIVGGEYTLGIGSSHDMAAKFDGEYKVEVLPSGKLTVLGKIWNNPDSAHYLFYVYGTLIVDGSYGEGIVENTYGGIECYSTNYVTIQNGATIKDSAMHGIYLYNSDAIIVDSSILNNGASSIYCEYSNATIVNNTMAGKYILFRDDIEQDVGWSVENLTGHVSTDIWHRTNKQYHSTAYAWTCGDPNSDAYQDNTHQALVSPLIDLRNTLFQTAKLTFWQKLKTDGFDICSVEISMNNGSTWTTLYSEDGSIFGIPLFEKVNIDISEYIGNNVKIRFCFQSDSAETSLGWYIDDVEIVSGDIDNYEGIFCRYSSPVIKNNIIYGHKWGVHALGAKPQFDGADSNQYFIGARGLGNSEGIYWQQYQIRVLVLDKNNNALPSATVKIQDKTDGLLWTGLSDASGYTPLIDTTDYKVLNNGFTNEHLSRIYTEKIVKERISCNDVVLRIVDNTEVQICVYPDDPVERFAILIAPIWDILPDEHGFKNDLKLLREYLINNGWYDENVWFLTKVDDINSEQYIDGDATFENLQIAFDDITWRSDGTDIIFIAFLDHGGGYNDCGMNSNYGGRIDNGSDPTDPLPNDENYNSYCSIKGGDSKDENGNQYDGSLHTYGASWYDDEFAMALNNIDYKYMVVLVDACFSGGFIEDCSNDFTAQRRIICTSAPENDFGHYCSEGLYLYYTHHFALGLNDISADSDYSISNHNGLVEVEEAHAYAIEHAQNDPYKQNDPALRDQIFEFQMWDWDTTANFNLYFGESFKIDLYSGINFIGFNYVSTIPYTAYSLGDYISNNSQPRCKCYEILRWNVSTSSWDRACYDEEFGEWYGPNFDVTTEEGYIIKVKDADSWPVTVNFWGDTILVPQTRVLYNGINSITVPYTERRYTAYSLADSISTQSSQPCTCYEVLRWNLDTNSWDRAYYDEEFGEWSGVNFAIVSNEGYIVKLKDASSLPTYWTPTASI